MAFSFGQRGDFADDDEVTRSSRIFVILNCKIKSYARRSKVVPDIEGTGYQF
jgi:hypothetical protein